MPMNTLNQTVQYRVLTNGNVEDLVREVNHELARGGALVGGIATYELGNVARSPILLQAMMVVVA